MSEGRVLFIDDATLISPAVLAVAYPAMDGRREITVKAHKGEVIKAADGFYVVSRPQPRSPRRDPDRGPVQPVLGPGQGLHRLRPRPRPQDRPPRDHAPPATSPPGRPAARSAGHPSSASCSPTPRSPRILGEDAAIANLAGIAPEEDRDAVAEAVAKAFGRKTVAPLALGRQL